MEALSSYPAIIFIWKKYIYKNKPEKMRNNHFSSKTFLTPASLLNIGVWRRRRWPNVV